MFRTLDETEQRYRAGELGTDQVGELARAFRNPRCGDQLADSEALLLEHERDLTAKQFEIAVKHWLSVADAEGIKQRHDSLHKHRDLRITPQFDGGFKIDGTFGPEQGAAIKEIHDRYTETERLADWAEAKAEYGDNVYGPDATSHQTDVRPITSHPGAPAKTPPQVTARPYADATTGTKNTATTPTETPTATGTSNDPTAPPSPQPRDRRPGH
jgi:Domain of unknown function (DUF222)